MFMKEKIGRIKGNEGGRKGGRIERRKMKWIGEGGLKRRELLKVDES